MDKFIITIGIEIHIELLTKTKLFSASLNSFGEAPNTQINEIDMGYPGSLPTLNKTAVIFAIKLAKSLNMEIDHIISFDRKHYYYPDLPKGYQITQQSRPIGKNGYIPISENKNIDIQRIHMEEDTAKQIKKGNFIYLDFNRAGIPLIEIVTDPVIHSADDAVKYIKTMQLLVKELGISDGKMENGSLRADINISLSKDKNLGNKVEIKNMNSFNNVRKAINNEIETQSKLINEGKEIVSTTKRFDEKSQTNIVMREKANTIDYRYFKEPNLTPINISKQFVDDIKIPILPWQKLDIYKKWGLNDKMIEQLFSRRDLALFFDNFVYEDKFLFAKILFSVILPLANKNNKKIDELNLPNIQIIEVLNLLKNKKISNSHVKSLIPLLNEKISVNDLINKYKMYVINSPVEIKEIILKIMEKENIKFTSGNKNTKKILLGKLMKETSGQSDVEISNQVIEELEKTYNNDNEDIKINV